MIVCVESVDKEGIISDVSCGLVVMARDSCLSGREFQSQQKTLDGYFLHFWYNVGVAIRLKMN